MLRAGTRYEWAPKVALVVALAHAVAAWSLRAPGFAWGEDDAAYLLLAQELRHFSYREVQDVLAPMHARFPPLFPVLLAIVGAPFGDNLDVLIAFVALCSAGALLLFYDGTRRVLGDTVALPAALLLAINPAMLWMGGNLMAEAPFVLLTMLALWALAREDESPRFALLAGIAVYLAALTRTAGVVFVVAIFGYWVARKRYRRAALFSSVGVLTIGAWLAWTFAQPDPDTRRLYIADLGLRGRDAGMHFVRDMAGRIGPRLKVMLTNYIPTALSVPTVAGTAVDNAGWLVATLALGGAGVVVLWRRWMGVIAFLVPYLLLLLVWRFQAGRFLTPIVPLLLLMVLGGAAWVSDRYVPKARGGLLTALTLLLTGGALVRDVERAATVRACDRRNSIDSPACFSEPEREALQLARWVRDSTAPGDVFFVSKERAFFVHSGRRSINQDRGLREPPDSLAAYLRARQVRYAVVTPVGVYAREHNALLARACRDFAVVRQFAGSSALLRVRDAGEADDGGATCRTLARWRPRDGRAGGARARPNDSPGGKG